MGYKRRGGGGGRKKRRFQPYTQWGDYQGPSQNGYYDRREPPPAAMPQRPFRPKVLGPCFRCGGYGHIAKFCSMPNRPYPFSHQGVSSTGVNKSDARSDGLSVCVDCVNTEVSTCNMCVNELVAIERVMFKESVNVEAEEHGAANKGVPYNEFTTQFWEVESQGPVQITDVQGRLRQSLAFGEIWCMPQSTCWNPLKMAIVFP